MRTARRKGLESPPMTLIVGTKTDLAYQREVSYEEGQALANDINSSYIEISSAINTNVQSLFHSVLTQLIEKIH